MLVNEVSGKQRVKHSTTTKTKEQLLSKEALSPMKTMFKGERNIPL